MALLPPRQGKMVSPENPGYRPTKEFLAAADRSHARGTATHAGGVLRAKQGGLLLSRPLQIAQLSLQDVRRGAVTSLDILRAGRMAVLCFWATGVGGGVDPQVPCHTPANTRASILSVFSNSISQTRRLAAALTCMGVHAARRPLNGVGRLSRTIRDIPGAARQPSWSSTAWQQGGLTSTPTPCS